MTKKEVLTKVVENFDGLTDEEREILEKMIQSLDKKSSKPTKAQIANEGVKAQIIEVLGEEPKTAREIADAIGETTNKVAALLRQIDGVEKIPGAKTKDAPKYKKA